MRRKRKPYGKNHHGSYTTEYRSWQAMMNRCFWEAEPNFSRYGGRGITVAVEWQSFSCFLKDMGKKPSKKHSLDRIDNDGNYTADNCRWADKQVQAGNTSTNVLVDYKGEVICLSELSRRVDIAFTTLRARLMKGLTGEALWAAPIPYTKLEIDGIRKGRRRWAKEAGLSLSTIYEREKSGKKGKDLIAPIKTHDSKIRR